jgi:hypothetical protein
MVIKKELLNTMKNIRSPTLKPLNPEAKAIDLLKIINFEVEFINGF